MKVLISHYGYIDGPGFSRSYMLARELSGLGHHVTFITNHYKNLKLPYKKEIREGICLISFPEILPFNLIKTGFGLLSILLKIIFVLRNEFDIVHADAGHRPSAGVPCKVHRFFKKSSYIAEWWDYLGRGGQYELRPWLSRLIIGNYDLLTEVHDKRIADGVVALSKFTYNRALKEHIDQDRLCIIRGGADVTKIKYFDPGLMKDKYGFPKDSLILGFIGINNFEVNDLMPLFEALQEIQNSNILFLTTGGYINQKIIDKYKLKNIIKEFGWLPYSNYTEVISCIDVFILLQRENLQNKARWPNKIGDYFSVGRPIMTNSWGETEYLAELYPNSFYIVKWNKADIMSKTMEIFKDRKTINEISKANRQIAVKDFSWQMKGKDLERFYQIILALQDIKRLK